MQSHDLASEEDLEALKYFEEPKPRSAPSSPRNVENSIPTPAPLAAVAAAAAAASATQASVPGTEHPEEHEAEAEIDDPFEGIPILHRAPAELYLFDLDADVFVIQEKDVSVDMASNGDYDSECRQSKETGLT